MNEETSKNISVPKKAVQEYDTAFAERMKTIRDERGLKRDWVARQIGVHYNTLKNWELGKSHPGTREILALCKVYHVKPDEFFKGL